MNTNNVDSSHKSLLGNSVELYAEGPKYYNQYLDMIDQAEKSIHLQTYIFDMDSFGQKVFESLKNAASRGVKVYLLIDAFGSITFQTKHEVELINAGIIFCRFNNFSYRWLYQWARRLHHKILLIDEKHCLIGGINVCSLSYNDAKVPHQLDFAVYLNGPINLKVSKYCFNVFKKSNSKENKNFNIMPLSADQVSDLQNSKFSHSLEVKLSTNDWVYGRWQITKEYAHKTKIAKKNITIINSYFFPRRKFMKQLVHAARRGVKVKLILPKHSDWPSYVLATRHLYLYFLKNGVEIYEWNKSILHGKLATVDGRFSTIGSFNLNYTSYQQNLEMNVDVMSDQFTQELDTMIEENILSGCRKIQLESFEQKTSFYTKCRQFFYYALLSTVAGFSVSLTYQEKDS